MDWATIVIIIQLIFLEGILSLDNAAVLGALVSPLPDDKPVAWGGVLRKLGDLLHPILGNQRTAALRAGLLGAYLGRGLMLFLATLIIQNPWLKLLGAAYLVRLAFNNLSTAEVQETDSHAHTIEGKTFWMIVLTVELTDLVFSLDNVVASVALSHRFWVVFTGVAIGILFMRFAAGLFSYAVLRHPVLKYAAYILVFNIGIELIIEELNIYQFSDWTRFGISVITLLLALAYERFKFLQQFRPVLIWLSQGFGNMNELIDWALVPVFGLFRLIWQPIQRMASRARSSDPDDPLPSDTMPVTLSANQELKSLPELES
jgi:tellurite resistance protein TerC